MTALMQFMQLQAQLQHQQMQQLLQTVVQSRNHGSRSSLSDHSSSSAHADTEAEGFRTQNPIVLERLIANARHTMNDGARNWWSRLHKDSGLTRPHYEAQRLAVHFDSLVKVLDSLGPDSEERNQLLCVLRTMVYQLFKKTNIYKILANACGTLLTTLPR